MLGFKDLTHASAEVFLLVRNRLASGKVFSDRASFPLPKAQEGAVRSITVLNPADELILRTYVGRCSQAIKSSTNESRVLNGLVRRPGPGWYSVDFRTQARRRRELQRKLYEASEVGAVAFFDIQDSFKSCNHNRLRDRLADIGAPPGAIEHLCFALDSLFPSGDGLPIGFEGSGVLANTLLQPLDTSLSASAWEFVRWTDDIDVFVSDVNAGNAAAALVAAELAGVDLRLNPRKCKVLEKGPAAEDRLLDPSRDSLFGDDAVANIGERLQLLADMKSMFDLDESLPAAHLRSFLGRLRSNADIGGVAFLQTYPKWIDREPRAVGTYLTALAQDSAARKKLDPDWLLELATREQPSKDTAAGQLHLCRALSEYRLDERRGAQLQDFYWKRHIIGKFTPLGAWAVRAWSESQAWTSGSALEVAHTIRHYEYGRAAIAGFADRTAGAGTETKLRQLVRLVPDLTPTVEYALAA